MSDEILAPVCFIHRDCSWRINSTHPFWMTGFLISSVVNKLTFLNTWLTSILMQVSCKRNEVSTYWYQILVVLCIKQLSIDLFSGFSFVCIILHTRVRHCKVDQLLHCSTTIIALLAASVKFVYNLQTSRCSGKIFLRAVRCQKIELNYHLTFAENYIQECRIRLYTWAEVLNNKEQGRFR